MEAIRCMNCGAEMDAAEVGAGYEICEVCDNEITEDTMEEALQALFDNISWGTVEPEWGIEGKVQSARNFREAYLLTSDRGVVVTMESGEEFQITIKRSK